MKTDQQTENTPINKTDDGPSADEASATDRSTGGSSNKPLSRRQRAKLQAALDEVKIGSSHKTRYPYVKGIPKDIQDIVFIHWYRYSLPESQKKYFDWWVAEISGHMIQYDE